MRHPLRAAMAEPRAHDAQPAGRADYLLVLAIASFSVLAAYAEPDVVLRPLAGILSAALALTLLWRRTHPLLAAGTAFWVQAGFDLVTYATVEGTTVATGTLFTGVILCYAVGRWASGRHIAFGMALVLTAHVASELTNDEMMFRLLLANTLIWLFPATLGVAMRLRASLTTRRIEDVRNGERAALARDLHDSVAHHVTAILVQARAAQTQVHKQPDQAEDSISNIISSATSTLGEMREVVRALRDDDQPAPAGVQAIRELADSATTPRVSVTIQGPADQLAPHVEASLFRIAQEGVTNALRHARGARNVEVTLDVNSSEAGLQVSDDGIRPDTAIGMGYGISGMTERVRLLDGTITTGPDRNGGWQVRAVIPISATSARVGVGK